MKPHRCHAGIRSLDPARYMDAHVLFRNRSTQRRELYGWLRRELLAHRADRRDVYAVLGVGSGTCVLDAALVDDLQHIGPVRFVGVDPNTHENETCRARMTSVVRGRSTARVVDRTIEEFDAGGARFDAVTAVHAFYYSAEPDTALRQALAPLAQDGAVFLLSAPDNALSSLFVETSLELHGFAPCLSDRMESALQRAGFRTRLEHIPAVVDVTPLCSPGDPEGELLLDFIVHADTRACTCGARERYRERVLELSSDVAGRAIVPHPVHGLVATR